MEFRGGYVWEGSMTVNQTGEIDFKTKFRRPDKVLCAAADVIEQVGWNQGQYKNYDGAVCLMGAVNAVLSGNPEIELPDYEVVERVEKLLRRRIGKKTADTPPQFISITSWNDESGRTKEEVLEVLRGDGC